MAIETTAIETTMETTMEMMVITSTATDTILTSTDTTSIVTDTTPTTTDTTSTQLTLPQFAIDTTPIASKTTSAATNRSDLTNMTITHNFNFCHFWGSLVLIHEELHLLLKSLITLLGNFLFTLIFSPQPFIILFIMH